MRRAGRATRRPRPRRNGERGESALTQLRAYLAQPSSAGDAPAAGARAFRDSRRVARRTAQGAGGPGGQGELWRHVGKGTFSARGRSRRLSSVAAIAAQTNPAEVMRARLAVEPELAREAALHAHCRRYRGDEALPDRRARAPRPGGNTRTGTTACTAPSRRPRTTRCCSPLFDTLNAVRRAVVWGRLRDEDPHPPADHHSFAEHEAIVAAIEDRDLAAAAARMRQHLENVQALLLTRGASRALARAT